jgi:hypothetical protein
MGMNRIRNYDHQLVAPVAVALPDADINVYWCEEWECWIWQAHDGRRGELDMYDEETPENAVVTEAYDCWLAQLQDEEEEKEAC